MESQKIQPAGRATPPPATPTAPVPKFVFRTHESLKPYTVSMREYLDSYPEYDAIATGALVFHVGPDGIPRLLIQKRSAHDSMPGRWETPGGACDLDDESVLHGAVRELWEESGLVAEAVVSRVGGEHVFFTRQGRRVSKFNFVVEVKGGQGDSPPAVTLDPEEHAAFLWVTEEECRAGRKGDVDFAFTTKEQKEVVLEAFRQRKDGRNGADSIIT